MVGNNFALFYRGLHAVEEAFKGLSIVNIWGCIAKLREYLGQNRAAHAVGTST